MTTTSPAPPPIMRAALLMLASTLFFGLMAVSIRLASQTLHAFEIAFFRSMADSFALWLQATAASLPA